MILKKKMGKKKKPFLMEKMLRSNGFLLTVDIVLIYYLCFLCEFLMLKKLNI